MDQRVSDGDPVADSGRPAGVTVAACILIAFGAFVTLVALAVAVLGGGIFLDLNSLPSWVDQPSAEFRAVSLIFGAGGLTFGALQVLAGIEVMRGRSWAQVAGIVLAAIGALVAGLGLLQGFGGGATGVTTIFLPVVALYLYAASGLAMAPGWFGRS
jgi:hypothetical protein